MKIIIKPSDFEMEYIHCPPGLFLYGNMIGLKSEYGGEGYCDSGETFCICMTDKKVIPLEYEIVLSEED